MGLEREALEVNNEAFSEVVMGGKHHRKIIVREKEVSIIITYTGTT